MDPSPHARRRQVPGWARYPVPPHLFPRRSRLPLRLAPCFQAIREHKKVNAGAQFFQTNLVFDPDGLETWLNLLAKRGILDKVYILIGIAPLKSFKVASYMNEKVPGVFIPGPILQRLEAAEQAGGAAEEGIQITLELIEKIKTKQGVNGFHIMAMGGEENVPRIVQEAGLFWHNHTGSAGNYPSPFSKNAKTEKGMPFIAIIDPKSQR